MLDRPSVLTGRVFQQAARAVASRVVLICCSLALAVLAARGAGLPSVAPDAKLVAPVTLGGMVTDPSGQPISHAQVGLVGIVRDEVGQFIEVGYGSATTDVGGKWACDQVPAGFDALVLRLTHLEFRPAEYDVPSEDPTNAGPISKADLRAIKSIMTMPPGIRIAGVVLGTRQQPIAGAKILLLDDMTPPHAERAVTDELGRFKLIVLRLANFHLSVQAPGYAPGYARFAAVPGLEPFMFILAKGGFIKGRVREKDGQPVEGARVSVEKWHELPLLEWQSVTDAQGGFEWDSAPEGLINLTVTKDDYAARPQVQLEAGAPEADLILERNLRMSGRVVSADRAQPIPEFTVTLGRVYGSNDPPYWERNQAVRGQEGKFIFRRREEIPPENRVRFMVEATGYGPAVSASFPAGGWYTNDFLLPRGMTLRGRIPLSTNAALNHAPTDPPADWPRVKPVYRSPKWTWRAGFGAEWTPAFGPVDWPWPRAAAGC